MNVYFKSSGTKAILDILQRHNPETVILPANICPSVLTQVVKTYAVILAQVDNHFKPANYIEAVNRCKGTVSVVFVHPFGVHHKKERDTLNYCNVSVIDDYCLSDPVAIIEDNVNDDNDYVFSFGYSKVLDFGGGGAVLSKQKVPGTNKILNLIDNYALKTSISRSQSSFLDKSDLSLSTFKCLDYFIKLKNIHKKRLTHQKNISDIYSEIVKTGRPCLNSPWRFIIKMSPQEERELSRFTSISQQKLFYGKNYPILAVQQSEIQLQTHQDKTGGIPINLFHDFRFDCNRAEILTKFILGL